MIPRFPKDCTSEPGSRNAPLENRKFQEYTNMALHMFIEYNSDHQSKFTFIPLLWVPIPLSAKGAHLISVSHYLPQGKCLVHSEQSSLFFALAYQYLQGQTLREFFLKLQLWNLERFSEIKTCSRVFYTKNSIF